MEEEQEEFLHDLANLGNDVSKLKDLLELKNSTKNADTVRRLKISLQQAEEKRKLFNYRESLFNVPETDYKELTDIGRIFEPFFEFWDSAEKWESREKHWTHSVFEELDSDEVECSVSTIVMSLGRASKAFEKDGLGLVNEIVGEVPTYTALYHYFSPLQHLRLCSLLTSTSQHSSWSSFHFLHHPSPFVLILPHCFSSYFFLILSLAPYHIPAPRGSGSVPTPSPPHSRFENTGHEGQALE